MCGIAGGWLEGGAPEEGLRQALAALRHRGPDDQGMLRDGQAFLAMRRLAILDLAGGAQPMANEDGRISVVLNGEIYNYLELRRELAQRGHRLTTQSDTEVLVHLYEEHGPELCRSLRGMFAFALWDAGRQVLLVARDRFGKKPLYYMRTADGGLLFASELKALTALLRGTGKSPEIAPQAIYDYLSLAVVPQPETVWQGIFALPPAHYLRFADGRLEVAPYWRLAPMERPPTSYAAAVEETRQRVAEAVRLRLRSDVPLGVFLSGGVDSSVVAYEASRELGEGLATFTVAVADPELDESALAAETARSLGVSHTLLHLEVAPRQELEHLVACFDQPFADPSAIPSLAISRLAREHVKVVLNGDGGDEIFGGYRRYLAARYSGLARPLAGLLAGNRRATARRSAEGFVRRLLRGLALPAEERYLAWTTDMLRQGDKQIAWLRAPMRPTEEWLAATLPREGTPFDRLRRGDLAVNLLSDLLVKMDMATMSASLEARSPLLDHPLAELTASLPDHYLVRRGRLKPLLRDAYRQVLPRAVTTGPKRGFEIPLAAWLETDLREVLNDTLRSPGALVRGWLDPALIDGLLAGSALVDRNRPYLIYALLVLELWLRRET